MQKTLSVLALVFVLSLTLTACGVDAPVTVAPSLTPAPSTLLTDFPNGKFMAVHDPTAGMIFADNTWTYYYGDTVSASGTYTIDENLWIESGTGMDRACPFPATYSWTFDGTILTFTLVGEDNCTARRETIAGRTFALVP